MMTPFKYLELVSLKITNQANRIWFKMKILFYTILEAGDFHRFSPCMFIYKPPFNTGKFSVNYYIDRFRDILNFYSQVLKKIKDQTGSGY